MSHDYQPGSATNAEVEREEGLWTLVFVRELRQPPDKVWRALTDPNVVREWAPFDVDRDLGSTGAVELTLFGGPSEESFECEVRHADAPRLLRRALRYREDRLAGRTGGRRIMNRRRFAKNVSGVLGLAWIVAATASGQVVVRHLDAWPGALQRLDGAFREAP